MDNLNGWAISNEVYEWILQNVMTGSTILEFGSGTGTKELVKYYKVYSIEEDMEWVGFEKRTNYIYAPIVEMEQRVNHSRGWYDIDYDFVPKEYSLLLVDGPMGNNRCNFRFFYKNFYTDCPIIFDDTHRDGDNELAEFIAKELNRELITIEGYKKQSKILI